MKKKIDNLIFDLDDTLYSKSLGVCANGWQRLYDVFSSDIKHQFGIGHICLEDYKEHGDKLLRESKNLDWDAFMGYICDLDVSVIECNQELKSTLERLDYKKAIFTNGDYRHMNRVLDKLDLQNVFEHKFTCADSNFYFKPEVKAFDDFFAKTKFAPSRSAFFEDSAKNLKKAKEYGMTTVLIAEEKVEKPAYCDFVFANVIDALKIFE